MHTSECYICMLPGCVLLSCMCLGQLQQSQNQLHHEQERARDLEGTVQHVCTSAHV